MVYYVETPYVLTERPVLLRRVPAARAVSHGGGKPRVPADRDSAAYRHKEEARCGELGITIFWLCKIFFLAQQNKN